VIRLTSRFPLLHNNKESNNRIKLISYLYNILSVIITTLYNNIEIIFY